MKKGYVILNIMKWIAIVVAVPFLLFLILAILVYLPPVQNYAVRITAEKLSERMDMDISVEKVRLAFPLDLSLHGVMAVEHGDTLADIRALRLNIPVRPLLKGEAKVQGIEIYDTHVNTRDYIADIQARGTIGMLKTGVDASISPLGCVKVNGLHMSQADLYIALSDTAVVDTTEVETKWDVDVKIVRIEKSKVCLSMNRDEMRIRCGMEDFALGEAKVNTAPMLTRAKNIQGNGLSIGYATRLRKDYKQSANDALMHKSIDQWDKKRPQRAGLDPTHVLCDEVELSIASLAYLPDGTIQVDVPWFAGKERSGLQINELIAKGQMKGNRVNVEVLKMKTPHSRIEAKASVPLNILEKQSREICQLDLNAQLGWQDLHLLSAPWVDGNIIKRLPHSTLSLCGNIDGGRTRLRMKDTQLHWQGVAQIDMEGEIKRPLEKNRTGEVHLQAKVADAAPLMQWLPTDLQMTLNLPKGTRAKGIAKVNGDRYAFDGNLMVQNGKMALNAELDPTQSDYFVDMDAMQFPVAAILPTLGIGTLTGSLCAEGKGFDLMAADAQLAAKMNIKYVDWQSTPLGQCQADVSLNGQVGEGTFALSNDFLNGEGSMAVDLRDLWKVTLDGNFDPINIKKIAQMKDTLLLSTALHIEAYTNAELTEYGIKGNLADNKFITAKSGFTAKDVDFDLAVNPSQTTLCAEVGDLISDIQYHGAIDGIADQLMALKDELVNQSRNKDFDQEGIRQVLPALSIDLNIGTDNPVSNILRMKGYAFDGCQLLLNTDNQLGINGQGSLSRLKIDDFLLENIGVKIGQNERGITLDVNASNKGDDYEPRFSAKAHGYLYDEDAGVELTLLDGAGRTGVDLGLKALLEENGLRAHFYPERPIIAYRHFNLNDDNYLHLGRGGTIGTDIRLSSDDGSSMALYSIPDTLANDLTLTLNKFELGGLTDLLPFLPQIKGTLGGDIHLIDDHRELSAMGTLNLANFEFEDIKMGDVGLEVIYMPKEDSEHHFNAFVSAAETEVMALEGVYYNNRNGHFEGKADMMNFPLHLLNGFLIGTDFALKGNAGGTLNVVGNLTSPKLDGALQFDEAHLYSDVYGLDFRMDEQAVPINGGMMHFNDYNLYSKQSQNPLQVNGKLDLRQLDNPQINITLQAKNFELINSKRQKQSLAFGKVYTDFNGTVRGSLDKLVVRGNLGILPGTNMTYILKDSPLTVEDRLNSLVKFVDFNDTTTVKPEPVERGQFDLALGISINETAKFHCDLSNGGDNYVDIEGGGDLTLRMNPQDDMRMTGRFTVGEGEMKYSLPVIPLKKFKIQRGSYVEFTGDMMNPTLNITATEKAKATVTENDVPRSVAFDVGVKVSRQLNNMGLEFVIDAPDDIDMQNQLTQMTTEQRSKTAVSLLATGMYLNDDMLSGGGGGLKASDALTTFLQSEIQNIAGNALRTVDLSVGMESGVSATGTNTTDYSFQFAKRFWGNRISVIVGGRVSTGEGATNTAESFIDNVAVEYRLDKGSSRYVRAFYDRGTRDPFEGQLTKTGVGLVLRRKTNRLGELFIFRNKKEDTPTPQPMTEEIVDTLTVKEE